MKLVRFCDLDSPCFDLALCSRGLNMVQHGRAEAGIAIYKYGNTASRRQDFQNELKALCRDFIADRAHTGHVSTRMGQAGDQPSCLEVSSFHDNGYFGCCM